MIEIRPLRALDPEALEHVIVGYSSDAAYRATKIETNEQMSIELRLTPLAVSYVKQYPPIVGDELQHYQEAVDQGHSVGAFDGDICVGIAITEMHAWNASFWVLEFHIAPDHQGQGIGRQLMAAVVTEARAARSRLIALETQATNVPAIRFYRAQGFVLEGVDLSLYTNQDYPDGEMALFMKKHLD